MACLPVDYITQTIQTVKTKIVNFCLAIRNETAAIIDEFLSILGPPLPAG